MATTGTTIADKLYVTIQYRGDTNNEDGHLGFASPYTKDAAFEKRKHTQDNWAYGYGVKAEIDDEDNITVTGEGNRGGYGASATKWDASMLFATGCYPKIIDNAPVEGFQIAKSVRRYGWNGGGNVKWRITDPRGFDLEISSENFASVLACSTMVNGVIQGNCVWGRMGKDNVLLPEASEPYQEAVAHTNKMNKKVSLKDVKPGDTVELFNNNVDEKQAICEYLGKHFFLCSAGFSEDGGYTYSGYGFTSQAEGYLFRDKSGEYFTVKTPKVIDIVTQCETALDRAEIAKEATAHLAKSPGAKVDNIYNCFLITPTKVKPETVTMWLEPITEPLNADNWPMVDNYYPENIICQDGNQLYVSERSSDSGKKGPTLTTIEIVDAKIKFKMTKVSNQNRGYWYSGSSRDHYTKVQVDSDPAPMQKFRITVTANGLTGKVYKV